jgi:6-phosphogluconolactonase
VIIQVFDNSEGRASPSAAFIAEQAGIATAERRLFNIAFSGGSTPEETYKRLAQPPYSTQIHWTRVHVFWSDERCVPPEIPQSNYRSANEVLLKHVSIPPENIHRLQGELPPLEGAAQANRELAAHFGGTAVPNFDLILLGLGQDGHTASLFPESEALKTSSELIAANYVAILDTWRLTFTYPLINAATQILFMVSGESKAKVVKRVIEHRDPTSPASAVQPASGNLHWFLDRAAGSHLSQQTLGN